MTNTRLSSSLDLSSLGQPLYRAGNEVFYSCPNCTKEMGVNEVKGVFRCFRCDYKGKLVNFTKVQHFNSIEIEQSKLIEICKWILDNSPVGEDEIDFLRNRSVPVIDKQFARTSPSLIKQLAKEFDFDYLLKSGVYQETKAGPSLSRWLSPGRLVIGWYDINRQLYGIQTRSLEDHDYLFPRGSKIGSKLFSPLNNPANQKELIITEGAFKAIVGADYGFETYAINGIAAVNNKEILASLAKLISRVRRYFVAIDADVNWKDKEHVLQAMLGLLRIDPKKSALLVLGNGEKKVDLDEYLIDSSAKDIEHRLETCWDSKVDLYRYVRQRIWTLRTSSNTA